MPDITEPITFGDIQAKPLTDDVLEGDPRINDVLLHIKDSAYNGDDKQGTFIAFPFTKFDNVLGRPRVSPTLQQVYGAPYVFLTTEQPITEEEYSVYFAHIQ